MLRMSTYDPSSRRLRLLYVRYADDYILLTNGDIQLAEKFKALIKEFLEKNLGATLSDEKTVITDLRKKSDHFLGFELRRHTRGRTLRIKRGDTSFLAKAADVGILAFPDRQRVIERLHAKGFCEPDGFPREVPCIANLEASVIIERYNASMRGMVNYFAPFVTYSSLARWIYILRFSCLKNLARKYQSSISKVFRRFGVYLHDSSRKTVRADLVITLNGVTYVKEFYLLTYKRLIEISRAPERRAEFNNVFWTREHFAFFGKTRRSGYDW